MLTLWVDSFQLSGMSSFDGVSFGLGIVDALVLDVWKINFVGSKSLFMISFTVC